MTAHTINQEINGISKVINQLIAVTEELYGSIYDQLPNIESEIELTAKEVEILLDFFIHHEEQEEEETVQQLSRILKEVEQEVRTTTAHMVDESEICKIIESFLHTNKNDGDINIDDVMEVIYKVKERITDIELISMNAIIFSGKLGEEGKAFGVISDHIMSFSNKVEAQYLAMEQYANGLGDWNNQFTESLNMIIRYHRKLTTEQLDEFVAIFGSVFSSLETIRKVLGELNSTVQGAVGPVQELMIKIQIQDLLQQGLENIQKCLQTIIDNEQRYCEYDDCTSEDKLNMLAANKALVMLVIDLLMNIKDKMFESLASIEEPLLEMEHTLTNLVEDEKTLSEYFVGKEYETNIISVIFSKVNEFFEQFGEELTVLEGRMNEFSHINDAFYEQINQIEKRIRKIKNSIGYLERLNLLSRIELSRMQLDGSAFVSQIQDTTNKVIEEVNKNEEYVSKLKVRLQDDLNRFQSVLKINTEKTVEMKEVIESAKEKLEVIEQLITEAIRPIGSASVKLFQEIVKINGKLTLRMTIYSLFEMLEEKLFDVHDKMDESFQAALKEAGVTEWEIHSQDLQEIVRHFTTHSERVVAQLHISDPQLDVGSDGGELTLF